MDNERILVKNSGFGTHIASLVGENIDSDPLWSARLNATNPQAVIQTHLDFLEAGSDIIVTNTYQATVDGYMKYLGLNREKSIELIKTSVKLAHQARDRFMNENGLDLEMTNGLPMIIASIGPYGAHLHDGSEYTGNYADKIEPEFAKTWHKDRIDAVLEAGVDALAIETIPCQIEATAIAELLSEQYPKIRFWITFQCKDESSLAHGEPFGKVVLSLWDQLKSGLITQNCLGIGVNCSHPKFITPLLNSINGTKKPQDQIPIVVYPNSGEAYQSNVGWLKKDDDCQSLEKYFPEWIRLGAKVVGGCCRTYCRDIPKYKQTVAALKNNIG